MCGAGGAPIGRAPIRRPHPERSTAPIGGPHHWRTAPTGGPHLSEGPHPLEVRTQPGMQRAAVAGPGAEREADSGARQGKRNSGPSNSTGGPPQQRIGKLGGLCATKVPSSPAVHVWRNGAFAMPRSIRSAAVHRSEQLLVWLSWSSEAGHRRRVHRPRRRRSYDRTWLRTPDLDGLTPSSLTERSTVTFATGRRTSSVVKPPFHVKQPPEKTHRSWPESAAAASVPTIRVSPDQAVAPTANGWRVLCLSASYPSPLRRQSGTRCDTARVELGQQLTRSPTSPHCRGCCLGGTGHDPMRLSYRPRIQSCSCRTRARGPGPSEESRSPERCGSGTVKCAQVRGLVRWSERGYVCRGPLAPSQGSQDR